MHPCGWRERLVTFGPSLSVPTTNFTCQLFSVIRMPTTLSLSVSCSIWKILVDLLDYNAGTLYQDIWVILTHSQTEKHTKCTPFWQDKDTYLLFSVNMYSPFELVSETHAHTQRLTELGTTHFCQKTPKFYRKLFTKQTFISRMSSMIERTDALTSQTRV